MTLMVWVYRGRASSSKANLCGPVLASCVLQSPRYFSEDGGFAIHKEKMPGFPALVHVQTSA